VLTFLFFAKNGAVLLALLAIAAGAGTLAAGGLQPLALRCALGLALWAEASFLLAAVGWLRPGPLIIMAIIALAGGAFRARPAISISKWWTLAIVAIGVPAFLLALHPPLAFDETLYHLPFVRSLALQGGLRFLSAVRFPVFPQLHELLCVPAYWLGGDVATHVVSLAEVGLTAAIVASWARRHAPAAGALAAALFISSPIVIALGTILYVDAALTLFVAAGFYALDIALTESRPPLLLQSGLFFGAACSVKYLGGYFALAALLIVIVVRRRDALLFAGASVAAAAPTTIWLSLTTGNPLFPFLPCVFGASEWTLPPDAPRLHRAADALRVVWDVTFARERMNAEPPITPLLGVLALLIAVAAFRDWRARAVGLLAAGYLMVFAFLPQDSRYLVPLLPLFCVSAAVIVARRMQRVTLIAAVAAVALGGAYIAWRLVLLGLPPASAQSRRAEIAALVAGYDALGRAGNSRVYVCGGEHLQAYAAGTLLGDFWGPNAYARILAGDSATIAASLRRIDVDYLLIVRRQCETAPIARGFALEYEDAGAQLWRVQIEAPR
jgi:hypothetical protein